MFLLFIRGTPCKVLQLHLVSYPPHYLNAKFQDGLLNSYQIIKPLKNDATFNS